MDNNIHSNKDKDSSYKKEESGVPSPLGEGTAGRGEAIEHQLKYLEEARRIVLNFDEIKDYAVFVFGSRADGTAHQRSDIDIGILGKQALPAFIKLDIEEKLENSNIPLRIDFVDFFNVDKAFRAEALKNMILWNLPKDIELD